VVEADISVLSSRCEAAAVWCKGDGVDGTKVAAHVAKLLSIDLVVEAGLKATSLGRGGRHLGGGHTGTTGCVWVWFWAGLREELGEACVLCCLL